MGFLLAAPLCFIILYPQEYRNQPVESGQGKPMNMTDNLLSFDVKSECEQTATFIEEKRKSLNREGILIGLSGGLDSATVAYLSARAVNSKKISLLYLPDRDSKNRHRKDAEEIARALGCPLKIIDISPALKMIGVYDILPLRFVPGAKLKDLLVKFGKAVENINETNLLSTRLSPKGASLVAKGNAYGTIKHRMRMVMLYYEANIHNLMVVGAANKTEYLTGTFSQWGCDQCADIMPVIHLYRSQLEDLAEYLGVPENIRKKPADPDIMPGVDNKEELLGSFRTADYILYGLENDVPKEELTRQFGEKMVDRICDLYRASAFMREAPYQFENGSKTSPDLCR